MRRIGLVLAAALATACGTCGAATAATVQVGESSSGKTVRLARGDVLKIVLQSYSDGGMQWQRAKAPSSKVLRFRSYVHDTSGCQPGLVGCSGYEDFTYSAVGAGKTKVALVLLFAGNRSHPRQRYTLTVRVPAPPHRTISQGQKDSGRTLEVRKGDLIRITLGGASGSTGYAWEQRAYPRPNVLRFVSEEIRSVNCPPHAVGCPEETTFVYRAQGRGTTRIRLALMGPSPSARPARRFHEKVIVS